MIDIDALKRDKRPQSAWVVHALIDRLDAAEADALEQARLNGMGAERELALIAKLEAAEKERDDLRESEKWYRRRCDLLQEQQSKMRDPERTIVCDILANGVLLHADFAGDRYTIPGEMTDDKRRIDACLKACEGLSTQNLEDNIPFLELVQRYNAMQRERDALRQALQGLLDALPSATTHPAINAARAAIARTTGDQP